MTLIAVLLALLAAALNGLASFLEHRTTKQVPRHRMLSPRLLSDLTRRPLWLVALAVNVGGNLLQVVALHFGALALVQPLLVTNLLFAVMLAALARHRRPDLRTVLGAVCCAGGIATFIAVSRPHGGYATLSFWAALPLIGSMAAAVAGCVAFAQWGPRKIRAVSLALACGADFGLTAFLLKVVPDTLPLGFADPARQWPLYLLVIAGPVGFLLKQNALQMGVLIAPVLAAIITADPLTSVGIAHWCLNEQISDSPVALSAEAIAMGVMTLGIVLLAQHAPATGGPGRQRATPGVAAGWAGHAR